MRGLLRVIGAIVAMSVALAAFTDYDRRGDAKTWLYGLPVVSVRQQKAQGWLSLGQTASGVLVIAQGGYGVVAFSQVGAGVLFGLGQAMFSLVTLGQVGVGLFAFVGQGGLGAQVFGAGIAKRSSAYFSEVSDELDELMSWSGR